IHILEPRRQPCPVAQQQHPLHHQQQVTEITIHCNLRIHI
ncbi:unnamed protein product, partial [Adineta steineri]